MSNNQEADYSNYVVYGPDANCTLAICPAELSVYQYRPSLAANVCFLLFFAIAMIIHLGIGIKWRSWFFVFCMFWGCVCEIIGYGGRLLLWQNPFSFEGFLIQISRSCTHLVTLSDQMSNHIQSVSPLAQLSSPQQYISPYLRCKLVKIQGQGACC